MKFERLVAGGLLIGSAMLYPVEAQPQQHGFSLVSSRQDVASASANGTTKAGACTLAISSAKLRCAQERLFNIEKVKCECSDDGPTLTPHSCVATAVCRN